MDALFRAIKSGDADSVERLLDEDRELVAARDATGLSPLLAALYRGRTDIAGAILRREPTLSVFEAAAAGELDRIRALVEEDPRLATATSPDGYSPLGLAAFFKHRDVVRYLLDHRADPAAASRQGGFTPLHSAVATAAGPCDLEIVRTLLDAGADPNARSQSDGTPLHTAAFTGDVDAAKLLLASGADLEAKGPGGKTPREIARERGNDEVLAVLS